MLSGFSVQAADGTQKVVPVLYGDMSRQVASILNDNSENKMPSAPRIAVYITNVQLDRSRLSDSTHISKVNIRERQPVYDNAGNVVSYTQQQGAGYTVERLMPTPYKLSIKADIWSSNTDQKLQIMEQIMMLFNPSLEIQTTDNFVDWTSLSVVELTDITFSSRSIPQGVESEIDVGTLTFETPIWISPPTKVKRMGVIHNIIMSIHDNNYTFDTTEVTTIGGFDIFVYGEGAYYYAELLDPTSVIELLPDTGEDLWSKYGADLNWSLLLSHFKNFRAGITQLFLTQPDGNQIVGTVSINPLDETKLIINFDRDTFNTDTVILGKSKVNAIVNPETWNPQRTVVNAGDRILLLNDIAENTQAWNSFSAKANDIVEWDGTTWSRVFEAAVETGVIYTTNLRTGVQYKFDSGEWTRSFEGEYQKGQWKLVV
jgi:hypothetical protein